MQYIPKPATTFDHQTPPIENSPSPSSENPTPPARKRKASLSAKQRVKYLANFRLLLKLVWQVSPGALLGLVILTIFNGLLPLGTLAVSSLLLDTLVRTISTSPVVEFYDPKILPLLISYLGILAALTALGQILQRIGNSWQSLYQIRVGHYLQHLIADKAASLDLACFENPQFHNLLLTTSSQATHRPVMMILQLLSLLSSLTVMLSLMTVLFFWQWWVVPLIILTALVVFKVSARFATLRARMTQGRAGTTRQAQYLASLLTAEPAAKEVRLFGLKDYLLGRYRDLMAEIYEEERQLAWRQLRYLGGLATLAALIRPLLIAFAVGLLLLRQVTLGQFNLYLQALLQLESSLNGFMATLAQLHEHHLFVANLFQFLALEPEVETEASPVPPKVTQNTSVEITQAQVYPISSLSEKLTQALMIAQKI